MSARSGCATKNRLNWLLASLLALASLRFSFFLFCRSHHIESTHQLLYLLPGTKKKKLSKSGKLAHQAPNQIWGTRNESIWGDTYMHIHTSDAMHVCNIHQMRYIHTRIHTYKHTHIHSYIHAYIHTHIHVYMYIRQMQCMHLHICMHHMRRIQTCTCGSYIIHLARCIITYKHQAQYVQTYIH